MAKSISRMAFFVTRPISITMPMMENMFSVDRNSSSASTTPIRVSGSAAHQRQRLQEALELAGQDHVDEDHRQRQRASA
jgi:D-arabinose 1-dehydrogenase-like Zn-dependent alcohol dehydrogenase